MIAKLFEYSIGLAYLLWSIFLIVYWDMLYPAGYLAIWMMLTFTLITYKLFILVKFLIRRKLLKLHDFIALIGFLIATITLLIYIYLHKQ